MATHTKEQRLRVHHLTNLGGLIALAGLDPEPPDLLLGALLQIANGLSNCSARQRHGLASWDHKVPDERATGKRARKSDLRRGKVSAISVLLLIPFCIVFELDDIHIFTRSMFGDFQ